ncbi:FAD-binding domain-containing protein [Phaeosphaeriaceae sp. SRC1lsM3a]|nr:FAD-binding domain-containing protein [Stagonospora sp. SRC1lsM3a]
MSNEAVAAKAHAERVAIISGAVKAFYKQKVAFRIYHGSSNSTRAASRQEIVDISGLKHLISIDKKNKTALVEPGIAMDELLKSLLPHGLMPAVVPEFPGITAGGAFAGTAAESSSFRYGYFDKTVSKVEMVLGNGDIVQASQTENTDLFYGSAGALGTLGITTQLEVQLVPCGRYVEVTYIPVNSHAEALDLFANPSSDIDFLDAVMFSSQHGVVISGRLSSSTSTKPYPVVRFTRAHDPWFFTHIHRKLRCAPSSPTMTELIPIADFLFRYDRGVFWMAAHGWAPLLWNRLTRFFLDRMWRTRFQYRVVHLIGGTPHIIQDLAIPQSNAEDVLSYLHEEYKIYPLWLCPIKYDPLVSMHTALTSPDPPPEMLVNIGVWGSPNYGADFLRPGTYEAFVRTNRAIEAKVTDAGGLKWLYAVNYYEEDEFWKVYDKRRYEELRRKWSAEGLPSLWEKVRRGRQELRGVTLGGVLRANLYAALGVDRLVK